MMTQKMKELLNEFAERDFSTYRMLEVLNALHEIELDMRILKIHRERGESNYASVDKTNMEIHVYELQEFLKGYALDYEANDLLDSEVLKELEDEQ